MANKILWDQAYNSRSTVLTTELNSLANGSRSNAGTQVDNSANLDQYGKVELQVNFASTPVAGALVNVYAVVAADGTNYEDGSSSADPGSHRLVCSIPIKPTTGAQRLTSRLFPLEPAKTKFIVENKAGQSFPASGSTLTLYTANDELQ